MSLKEVVKRQYLTAIFFYGQANSTTIYMPENDIMTAQEDFEKTMMFYRLLPTVDQIQMKNMKKIIDRYS